MRCAHPARLKLSHPSSLNSPLSSQSQVQSYNTLHPDCHLLSFSISKTSKNKRLTYRNSVHYKHLKIFQNLTATAHANPHLTGTDARLVPPHQAGIPLNISIAMGAPIRRESPRNIIENANI